MEERLPEGSFSCTSIYRETGSYFILSHVNAGFSNINYSHEQLINITSPVTLHDMKIKTCSTHSKKFNIQNAKPSETKNGKAVYQQEIFKTSLFTMRKQKCLAFINKMHASEAIKNN